MFDTGEAASATQRGDDGYLDQDGRNRCSEKQADSEIDFKVKSIVFLDRLEPYEEKTESKDSPTFGTWAPERM